MPRVTGLCTAPRVVSTAYVRQVANVPHPPPLRNLAQFGVFEGVREQFCDFGFKLWAGGAADLLIGPVGVRAADGGLGADGVEVHEPALEDRPCHFLQRLVHFSVQLDLVVQRAENAGDGLLLEEGR